MQWIGLLLCAVCMAESVTWQPAKSQSHVTLRNANDGPLKRVLYHDSTTKQTINSAERLQQLLAAASHAALQQPGGHSVAG